MDEKTANNLNDAIEYTRDCLADLMVHENPAIASWAMTWTNVLYLLQEEAHKISRGREQYP